MQEAKVEFPLRPPRDWILSTALAILLGIAGADAFIENTTNIALADKLAKSQADARTAYDKLYKAQDGQDDALDTANREASLAKWQLEECNKSLATAQEGKKK